MTMPLKLHKNTGYVFFGILAAPFVFIGILLLLELMNGLRLKAMGYYVGQSSSDLVNYLVEHQLPASECLKFRYPAPWGFGPTQGDQQSTCIYLTATKEKDPSGCELLMPSEYGWTCLGEVASELTKNSGCSDFKNKAIYCSSGLQGTNIGIENCKKYSEIELQDWCYTKRSETLSNVNDCEKISKNSSELINNCKRLLAYKEFKSELCDSIENASWKSLCILKIKYAKYFADKKVN